MKPAPLSPRSLEALRIAVVQGAVYAGSQTIPRRGRRMIYGRTLTALAARGFLTLDRTKYGGLWGAPTVEAALYLLELAASRRDGSRGHS